MIKYDKLWKTLKDRSISQYKLINTYGISTGQLDRLRKNESVSTNTLDKLCDILNCDLCDIAEYYIYLLFSINSQNSSGVIAFVSAAKKSFSFLVTI